MGAVIKSSCKIGSEAVQ